MKRVIRSTIAAIAVYVVIGTSLVVAAYADSSLDRGYPYIVSELPVSGYVVGLAQIPSKPNYLFALVRHDGFKVSDKPGLYVFDISQINRVRQLTYLPIPSPVDMELRATANRLFIYNRHYRGYPDKKADELYGVLILDIEDPAHPKQIGKLEADILRARVDPSGNTLFLANLVLARERRDHLFDIYDVSSPQDIRYLSRVRSERTNYSVSDFFFAAGDYTVIASFGNLFTLTFDYSNAAAPQQVKETIGNVGDSSYPQYLARDGTLFLGSDSSIEIKALQNNLTKLGELSIRGGSPTIRYVSDEEKSLYISTSDQNVFVADVTQRDHPSVTAQFAMPSYIGSLIKIAGSNTIVVGQLGSIAFVDPNKREVTAKQLESAHARVLREYDVSKKGAPIQKLFGAMNAAHTLEAAGILDALRETPSGITAKKLAAIINDYGFFQSKDFKFDEAIVAYRRAIQLDPNRAIAYLNLGDLLRRQLGSTETYDDKVERTRDIISTYEKFKSLGGRPNAGVDEFLSYNIVTTPETDICEYIAKYANRGRLGEITGAGQNIAQSDGKRTMRVRTTVEGTAHYTYTRLIDNITDGDVTSSEEPDEGWNNEDTRLILGLSAIPFKGYYQFLYSNDGNRLIGSVPIGAGRHQQKGCHFSSHTTKEFFPVSPNTRICDVVKHQNRTTYVDFSRESKLPATDLEHEYDSRHSITGSGEVDFDNDGKLDQLVEIHYLSTAGRSCEYYFYDLLNETADRFGEKDSRSLLLKIQGIGKDVEDPIDSHCWGRISGWFNNDGVVYFEAKHPGDVPGTASEEFHTVSFIRDRKITKVCDARFRTTVVVDRKKPD